jgi:hypothetical protein
VNLNVKRAQGEIHLHIHTLSAFSNRLILLVEGDLPILNKPRNALVAENCHETASRQLNTRALNTLTLSEYVDKIYFKLLSPFTNVFYFFIDNVKKSRPIVKRLAL